MTAIDELTDVRPRCVNVQVAARMLGISRGSAYKLAHAYLDTGPGLPCVVLGRRLVVPRHATDALLTIPSPEASTDPS